MPPSVGDLLKRLGEDGWEILRQRGSHRQLKHPQKRGLVTVSGKLSDVPPPKTLSSIYKQAGWRK